MEGAAKDDKEPALLKIDPKWYVQYVTFLWFPSLADPASLQDALRTFFQPIKTDDPRLDFYAMYKREATEYDTDYVKKYDDDLNTTLIFVRCIPSASVIYLTYPHRRVCSLPSAPRLSSTSTRTSDPIPTSNPPPSSVPSSSRSISPPSPVRPPPFHLFSNPRRARSSPSPV